MRQTGGSAYGLWDGRLSRGLLSAYDWEHVPDTNANGRISDVAADFYIHLDHSVAGFSEHDTFRSNQAREGDQSREEALWLVADGNRQRYPNIKWYSVAVGLDFREVIEVLNAIPPLAGRAS